MKTCPGCGEEMFCCGTFGGHWNCQCGHIEDLNEEEQMEMDAFMKEFQHRLDNRKPQDIKNGEGLRQLRVTVRVSMRDLAQKLGKTSAEVSAWENGLVPITKGEAKRYTDALYETM